MVQMKTQVSSRYALTWVKLCTEKAKKTFSVKKENGEMCPETMVYNVSNVNMSLSEGNGSRRRRELIQGHHVGNNKWLELAKITANATQVQSPCWVCSFRPHHSEEMPTSVAIPVSTQETICLLWQSIYGRLNYTTLAGCESYAQYAQLNSWKTR